MRSYIQQQSVGGVIRNTFAIYGKGFVSIVSTYLLPVLPFVFWEEEALLARRMDLFWISIFFVILVSMFTFGAITITVSDICLGYRPSFARSYKKVFSGLPAKLLVTNLLQLVILIIGFVLLVFPGVIAALWFMFAPSVVVLEGTYGLKALKRSKAIANGYNLRNFGVSGLLLIIGIVCTTLISTVFFAFMVIFPQLIRSSPYRLLNSAIQLLLQPLNIIAVVLLYYDLRVRKENYDAAALAEDLKR